MPISLSPRPSAATSPKHSEAPGQTRRRRSYYEPSPSDIPGQPSSLRNRGHHPKKRCGSSAAALDHSPTTPTG
eukprot:6241574-Alexandrium_andersonii.AAC.1